MVTLLIGPPVKYNIVQMKHFETSEATDAQLLEQFENRRDQSAFAEIVNRHGAMVLATASRIVNREDAQDAFQATFLALAKGSGRLHRKEALPGWLHSTARRCSELIRRTNMRRARKEHHAKESIIESAGSMDTKTVMNPSDKVAQDEVALIFDEELAKLPSDLRVAVILCDVEGLSRNQAANRLGIPTSTLRDRLTKGRSILKSELIRRGVTASVTAVAAYIASSTEAFASVNVSLVADTTAQAMLFAAGKTAEEMSVSLKVINTANKVLSAMNSVKVFSLAISAAAFLSLVGVLTGVLAVPDNSARAGTILIDTFNDKNFADGVPTSWEPWSPGIFDTSSGDLVLSPSGDTDRDVGFGITAPEVDSRNQSVRTQIRILESGHAVSVGARGQSPVSGQSYFAVVGFLPQFGGSILAVGRSDSLDQEVFFDSINGQLTESLSHDVRQVDTIVQIDTIGDRIQAWAWPAGGLMPDQPQFDTSDGTYSKPGRPVLTVPGRNEAIGLDVGIAIFRYVHVADMPIHEIVPDPIGDFDGSGTLDDIDLDLLNEQIKIGGHDAFYDLNGDGQVTDDDRQLWVQDIAGTFLGDANLDASVDAADLNALALNWRQPIASWAAGDFNGDGYVSAADLNVLALNWRKAANAAVPEPSGLFLLSLVLATAFLGVRKGAA